VEELERKFLESTTLTQNCRNEVTTYKETILNNNKQYDINIQDLKSKYNVLLDKCESTVKSEKDRNLQITVDLRNAITKYERNEGELTRINLVVEENKKKFELCVQQSNTYVTDIDVLRNSVKTVNERLQISVIDNRKLQENNQNLRSERDTCNENLKVSLLRNSKDESTINKQRNDITIFETGLNECKNRYDSFNCASFNNVIALQDVLKNVGVKLNDVHDLIRNAEVGAVDYVNKNGVRCTKN